MRAFVVRSFGTKRGIDFEKVHRELIGPALARIGAGGGTTGEVIEAGNIREDMFEQLISADLVVADVSIHNANVFYELGIRHAARSRATVLIRASVDEVPFDLRTDRYLSYDPAAPGDTTDQLVRVLNATLAAEDSDSPVFALLGRYVPANQSTLISVPRTFQEDVASAAGASHAGELRLIAEEVDGLRFEEPALRLVAAALQQVGDNEGALPVWERLRTLRPDDLQANEALANIYRRLGDGSGADDLARASDHAIRRALSNRTVTSRQVAELSALHGSLSKRRWEWQWRKAPSDQRDREALRSRELDAALRLYRRGFNEDLNHYYPGLNTLALVEIAVALAERFPDEWRYHAASDALADAQLAALRRESETLRQSVGAAIEATRLRLERDSAVDPWLGVSFAELLLLRGADPERVANAYATIASPAFGPSELATVRQQLEIYRDLKVRAAQVACVFDRNPALLEDTQPTHRHPIVFAGHMIDNDRRTTPRFPAEKEDVAREAIKRKLQEIVAPDAAGETGEEFIGIAGASNGGDLLFHEVCQDLGIPTEVMLPLPELVYRATVQADHAARWAGRYHQVLRTAKQVHILSRTVQLPTWLTERADYSTWQRQNRWMLHHAWAMPGVKQVTAVALWDGEVGDGPGGVADLVATAGERGAAVFPISTTELFGLTSPASVRPSTTSAASAAADPIAEATPDPASVAGTTAPVSSDADLLPIWQAQQEFSAVASSLGQRLRRLRLLNLVLLVAGAILGATSALSWLAGSPSRVLSFIAAAVLAIAAFIQARALGKDQTETWIAARATSESLKADVYRFLARVTPYAGADRVEALDRSLADVRQKQATLRADHHNPLAAGRPLPGVTDFTTYVSVRAQRQADWHRSRARTYGRRNRQLRGLQLLVTFIGVVLTGIATVQPTTVLSSWTAAATTIAAALGAHLAGRQYRRLAITFNNTALLLDDVIATAGTAARSLSGQTRFIDQVEGILAAQNGSWPEALRAQ